ncbi:sensor histidine kinase [Streptomyces sp. NPDC048383]|uniref:sensor histidine kinase n=1 Tax=Streptomyces sp. NPDC048383 TaxID=3155386 RepID=UPI0034438645
MRFRVWPADRPRSVDPRWADAALALGVTAAAAVAGRQYTPPGRPPFDTTAYLLTACVALPLAARRSAPVFALVASSLGYACYLAAGYQPSLNFWAPAAALYGVAARRPPRTAAACAALCGAVVLWSGLAAPEIGLTTTVVQALGVPAVVWFFGNGARVLDERNGQLASLTARLRREQEWRERQAVAEEQRRIARELHDVVAHHMAVINVQAGMAGYVFPTAPEQARAALGTISDTSQEALRELRRILTLLRSAADIEDGEAGRVPYAPIPGLAGLADVAERVRAAGVAVDLRTDGTPRPLPPGVELCAYRVVQEALTNVIKHARHAAVTVLVSHRPHALLVTITDDGAEGADDRPEPANVASGPGHGLIGMRERAKLYGGTVEAGPRTEGGFRVCLTLPIAAGSAAGPRRNGPRRNGPPA